MQYSFEEEIYNKAKEFKMDAHSFVSKHIYQDSERNRNIVCMRIISKYPDRFVPENTFDVIAKRFNITRERARQIVGKGAREARRLEVPIKLEKNILDVAIRGYYDEKYGFSVRTANCFLCEDILTFKDLIKKDEAQLLAIPNFGKKSLRETIDILTHEGLHLGMTDEEIAKLKNPERETAPLQELQIPVKVLEKLFQGLQGALINTLTPVIKDRVVYKDKIVEVPREKIVTVEKHTEVVMPEPSKCIICRSYPKLSLDYGCAMKIACQKCGTQVCENQYDSNNLFQTLYKTINRWNKLGEHLTIKEENENTKLANVVEKYKFQAKA